MTNISPDQAVARPGISRRVIGRDHVIGTRNIAVEHVVLGHKPTVNALFLSSGKATGVRIVVSVAARRAAVSRPSGRGTRSRTAARTRRIRAGARSIRVTGLSGLLGVLFLLLLDLIHRCRHAIVGQPIDDLGVGEHDGFAIGKRDFVVRGLAPSASSVPNTICATTLAQAYPVVVPRSLLTSCPTRGSRAACACIMDGTVMP
mgnify:CR=1 FL=1